MTYRETDSAIEEVVYRADLLSEAKTYGEQASHAIELLNAVSNLKTWHSKYNYNTGMIEGMYDE